VEDEDHPCLAPSLEAECEHPGLNGGRGEGQEVIAAERGAVGVKQVRPQEQREQQAAEQAGPALLEAEQQEFVEPQPPACAGVEGFEPEADRLEAGVAARSLLAQAPCFRDSSRIASSSPSSVSGYIRSPTSCLIILVDCE